MCPIPSIMWALTSAKPISHKAKADYGHRAKFICADVTTLDAARARNV